MALAHRKQKEVWTHVALVGFGLTENKNLEEGWRPLLVGHAPVISFK